LHFACLQIHHHVVNPKFGHHCDELYLGMLEKKLQHLPFAFPAMVPYTFPGE
jgi:hypothetical protein